jgi:hypothetical protein
MVFRHLFCGGPDVISGQVDVLPAERGQMSQQIIRDIFFLAQGGDGAFQIPRVPQNDGSDEKIVAGDTMLLVFIGAVADLSEPMDEDRPSRAVAGLALIKLLAGCATQFGVVDPVQCYVEYGRKSKS